jgi:tetratricopeptide (TPR) repeat protein
VTVNGDIELEIGAGSPAGNYTVRVIRAAAGGEPVSTLKLDVEEMLRRRDLLEATVLASAVTRRSVLTVERPVREVGQQLFQALFTGPVYGMYRASLGVAQQHGKRLRVVLRLTAPELAALPWEMLFDPETETYLCRHEPLVRHVPAPYTPDPLDVVPPLRILGLVASPRGLSALDVETEKSHLAKALARPVAEGLAELVWVPEATWEGVHDQLLAREWHVVHFVGHGDYDAQAGEGVLALVGSDGRADLVEASRLADLLGEAQPTPRLVVLNSCSSGHTGTQDLFSATAAALVHSGISAVAAMQFAISDTAAIAFSRGFYNAIARGRTVDEAARSGRISILGTPRSLEWVTPVLYVRGQASQLFTLTAPPAIDPGQRRAELRTLYTEARGELRLGHFDTAVRLLDDLLALDPDYPDAAELRDTAQRDRQLADDYASARDAEESEDWAAAARKYDEILHIDPAYRDAAARKHACEKRYQAELDDHADAGQQQDAEDGDVEPGKLEPGKETKRALLPAPPQPESRALALAPLYSFGLLSPLPFIVWALKTRRLDLRIRAALYAVAVAALLASTSLFKNSVGGFVGLALMAIATFDALHFRTVLTTAAQRSWGRDLAQREPETARELRIGRPDLPRAIADGGLIDINSAGPEALAKALSLKPDDVQRLLKARATGGRFTDLEDLQRSTNLATETIRRAGDYVVFL